MKRKWIIALTIAALLALTVVSLASAQGPGGCVGYYCNGYYERGYGGTMPNQGYGYRYNMYPGYGGTYPPYYYGGGYNYNGQGYNIPYNGGYGGYNYRLVPPGYQPHGYPYQQRGPGQYNPY